MNSEEIQALTAEAIANIDSIESALGAARTAIQQRDQALQDKDGLITSLQQQITNLQSIGIDYGAIEQRIDEMRRTYQAQIDSLASQVSDLNQRLTTEQQNDAQQAQEAYNSARAELQAQIDAANQAANEASTAAVEAGRIRDEALAAFRTIVNEAAASRAAAGA